MNNFNLMKETGHIPDEASIGFSHSLRHREWHRQMMKLHTWGRKVGDTLSNKHRIVSSIHVEPNPLSGVDGIQFGFQQVMPLSSNQEKSN